MPSLDTLSSQPFHSLCDIENSVSYFSESLMHDIKIAIVLMSIYGEYYSIQTQS